MIHQSIIGLACAFSFNKTYKQVQALTLEIGGFIALQNEKGGGDTLARIEKTIEIKRPPEEVWPLGSKDRLPEWFDMIEKAEWTSKTKDTEGATVHLSVEVAGIKGESDVEMTECVKNQKRG